MQSHTGEIVLLPALPAAWPNGSVQGLCAQGGFELGIVWKHGKLTTAQVVSTTGTDAKIRCGDRTLAVNLVPGRTVTIDSNLQLEGGF